jgi:FKBP-type peptidyl-prolyl cis-trans isomerase SlyD
MTIQQNSVVGINYTLKNDDGEVLDTSEGREALYYLQGNGNLIIGLEEELFGKSVGDKLNVSIQPEKGYGLKDEQMIQEVPVSAFGGQEVAVGMTFTAENEHGRQMFTIAAVNDETVTVDANHPLAGQTLHFDVEIVEVREATADEIAHGHVHGIGGVEH